MTLTRGLSKDTIWIMVDGSDQSACLLWPGATNSKGAGTHHKEVVHRIVYERYIGPIPVEHYVRRECHNKLCINPDHLWIQPLKQGRASKPRRVVAPLIYGDIAFIPLTRDKLAIVDVEDAELVGQYLWHAHRDGNQGYRARRTRTLSEWSPGQPRSQFMHQLLSPAPDGYEVDHRDLNPLNNQRSNLRVCTHAENMRNRTSSTPFKGVVKDASGRIFAQISVDGEHHHLGYFPSRQQAADAYDHAAIRLHGEFARTNAMIKADRR